MQIRSVYAQRLSHQRILTEGEASLRFTSCTNKLRSPAFHTETILYFFAKQPILIRRSIVLSLPFQ